MKQDVQKDGICKWRIQSEGMPILEGYVGEERVVRMYKKSTFKTLLKEMFPKVTDGGWKNLGEIGERVRDIEMGCMVLRLEPSDNEDGFQERMVMPLWRSLYSLNLMLAKEDRSAMLLRLFNDTAPLINNHDSTPRSERKPAPDAVAPGFKIEDDTIVVDVSSAIEGNGPIAEAAGNAEIKPGPYGTIVGDKDEKLHSTVKMDKIEKGEDTAGPEQQLNGTGGVEGQLGGVS